MARLESTPMAYHEFPKIKGLVAATFTPLHPDGNVDLDPIPAIVDYLARCDVKGIFVLGSTGEGISMTLDERAAVAESYVEAARGKLTTIIHVGDNALRDAQQLASHASSIGANAISMVAPNYFKPEGLDGLVASVAEVAAGAPDLPFYYYHIPAMTGVEADMVRFLEVAPRSVPNLVGLKMTDSDVSMLPECAAMDEGRFNILFGRDEMLLAGMSMGAEGAVGTTYNYLAPLYNAIIMAFEGGDREKALRLQKRASAMIRAIIQTCGRPGLKACMAFAGHDCGPQRLPLGQASRGMLGELREKLDGLGFFQWSQPGYQGEV